MNEDDVLAVIEGPTTKKLAAKGKTKKRQRKTSDPRGPLSRTGDEGEGKAACMVTRRARPPGDRSRVQSEGTAHGHDRPLRRWRPRNPPRFHGE
jgi:hypothetical protein